GRYLAAQEYALLEEGLINVEGANWGSCRIVAMSQVELSRDDVRAHLSEKVIRDKHPEVSIWHDGRRMIDDPSTRWIEFTGRGAGRVKCDSASADARRRDYEKRYEVMKKNARQLIDHSLVR